MSGAERARVRRLRTAALVLLALVVLAAWLAAAPEALEAWVRRGGGRDEADWTGLVVIAALYVPACLLLVPGSWLTLTAGYLYGVAAATIAVSVGATTGAAAAFLAGRVLARPLVERRLRNHPRLHALRQAVDDRGFAAVLLARLSPVLPFNVLNYAFGLTSISWPSYVAATWLGMLPGTLLYCYLGATGRRVVDAAAGQEPAPASWVERGAFAAGLVVTAGLAWSLARGARRRLAEGPPQ